MKKISHLKLVTLTASSNTQTAHYQQNKNEDVPKKYPCCPQNICYTEYNQSSLLVMTIHRISAMFS